MRMTTLLTLVAVLIGAVATANAQDLRLRPIADSAAQLNHAQTVAVLYSENTVNTLEYLERYHAVAVSGAESGALDARISDAFVKSSEPNLMIDGLMSSLRRQFTSVTLYDSLDGAVQAAPDLVVVLDTQSSLVTQRSPRVEARYIAKFYDANLQYIGKAEGATAKKLSSIWVHGKAPAEIAAQVDQQRTLQLDALNRFNTSLKGLVSAGNVAQLAGN